MENDILHYSTGLVFENRTRIDYINPLADYILNANAPVYLTKALLLRLIDRDWPYYGLLSEYEGDIGCYVVKVPGQALQDYQRLVRLVFGVQAAARPQVKARRFTSLGEGMKGGAYYSGTAGLDPIIGINTDAGLPGFKKTLKHELTHYFQRLDFGALAGACTQFVSSSWYIPLSARQLDKLERFYPKITRRNWNYYMRPAEFQAVMLNNFANILRRETWKYGRKDRQFILSRMLLQPKPYPFQQIKKKLKKFEGTALEYYMAVYYGAALIRRFDLVQMAGGIFRQILDD